MEFKNTINIHNKFDFEVKDIRTGEITKKVTSYNILLNGIYSRLCTLQTFFDNIAFGDGTGTQDPTRTTLFNQIASIAATTVEEVRDTTNNIYYRKRKVVLTPENYNGKTITEVGIYGNGLNSHSLLKDSEGNSLSITKTATDEITIYATVYFQLSGAYGGAVDFIRLPNNNAFLNYLFGSTSLGSQNTYLGALNSPNTPKTDFVSWIAYASSLLTSDIPNKKIVCGTTRFGTDAGNYPIKEIYNTLGIRGVFPIPSVYEKTSLTNRVLGTGNGIKQKFSADLPDLPVNSLTVKSNNVVQPFTWSNNKMIAIKSTPIPLTNEVADVAFSPDSNYMVCLDSRSEIISVLKRNGDSFGQLTTITASPSLGSDICCTFSSDGKYLAIGFSKSPFISIYQHDGDTFTLLNSVSMNLSSSVTSISFSSDGKYLAIGVSEGVIIIFKISGDTFTKLPAITISGNYSIFSPDGKYLLVTRGGSTAPYVYMYKHDGDTFTLINSIPKDLSDPYAYAKSFSQDSNYLAVTSDLGVRIFKRDGDTFTRLLPGLSAFDGLYSSGCNFSPDGKYLVCTVPSTDRIHIYIRDGDTFTEQQPLNPDLSGSDSYTTWMSPDGEFLYCDMRGIYNRLFKSRIFTEITLATPPANGEVVTYDVDVPYIPKDSNHVLDVGFAIQFGEGAF